MLGNCSCFYFRLLTFFKIKPPGTTINRSVKQFGSTSRPTFCWSSSLFKLFAKGYWQTTILRWHAKSYNVFNILPHIGSFQLGYTHDTCICIPYIFGHFKYISTCYPLNKAKVMFKGVRYNQFYFPMLNASVTFALRRVYDAPTMSKSPFRCGLRRETLRSSYGFTGIVASRILFNSAQ